MNSVKNQLRWVNILLIPIMLLSCNDTRQRNIDKSVSVTDSISGNMKNLITVADTVSSELSENIIENRNIVHFESIMHDTIIGDFFISYIIRDNNDIISKQVIFGTGDTAQVEYADRSVFLDLKHRKGQTILSNKEINKYTFKSIVPQDEINQYQLWAFRIMEVEEEGILFYLNICKPDTDICYFIDLYISKDGDITMSEIEPEEEDY